MKRILILILTICSLTSFGQKFLENSPPQSPTVERINQAIAGAFVTSGTDTYTVTFSNGAYSYTALTGLALSYTFPNINTGASTLNFDALGAKNILKWSSGSLVAVAAGDLIGTVRLRYDGTQFVMEGGTGSGDVTYADLMTSRTLTSADDLDQTDNFRIVYADSGTPFNITVDLLTAGTQVSIINKGSATATLIQGSGVTLVGTTIAIPAGESALIIYEDPANPDVYSGGGGTSSLTIGSTSITSGTTTRVLYDNAGTLGEYTVSGTGNVAMTTSPVFTTPNIGTATGSITGNAATVTTNANLTGDVTSTGNATAIASGVIVNADVNASAAIAGSKLANTAAGTISATTVQTAIDELDTEKETKLTSNSTSTASGTVTFDMNSERQRMFYGSATFATNKTLALSNSTNALVFQFTFEVTNVAGTLTFPSGWLMADANFSSLVWTPPATGKYELGASYNGTNWYVKILGPFN